jgi:hypothetical protein
VDPFVIRVFQGEIETQCKFILAARHHLRAALITGSTYNIWKELQTILISAANVSKMLWGSGGVKASERTPLRESLGVADDSPLRDPKLRKDFEHFDERVERWFSEVQTGPIYVGRNIGPMQGGIRIMHPEPQEPIQRFGHFDPTTGDVIFWTHAISVPAVAEEAARLLEAAHLASRQPMPRPEE